MATDKGKEKSSSIADSEVEAVHPLSYHLGDLRKRFMYSFLFVIVVFCFCYWKSEYIFNFVTGPILPLLDASEHAKLTTLTLTEGFFSELKISLIAALMVSMPFILFQFWKFVAPGLYRSERRYLVGFVFFATLLFLSGAAFAYYLVFPLGFKFFISISAKLGMNIDLSFGWYIGFVIKLVMAFGIVFEMPVVVFFLAKIGLVNTEMMKKYRKFAVVGIFVLAAVITPPDVISQLMMSAPMLILYEISIWITKVVGKKPLVAEEEADIYE